MVRQRSPASVKTCQRRSTVGNASKQASSNTRTVNLRAGSCPFVSKRIDGIAVFSTAEPMRRQRWREIGCSVTRKPRPSSPR